MKKKSFRNPQGNALHSMLLQVIGRDSKGRPTDCRMMHEDETIDLAAASAGGGKVQFLLVWGPSVHPVDIKAKPAPFAAAKLAEKALDISTANVQAAKAELKSSEQALGAVNEKVRIATWLRELSEGKALWLDGVEATEGQREAAEAIAIMILEHGKGEK